MQKLSFRYRRYSPGYWTLCIRLLSCCALALATSRAVADFGDNDRYTLNYIGQTIAPTERYALEASQTAANIQTLVRALHDLVVVVHNNQYSNQDSTDAQLSTILSAVRSGAVDLSTVESLLTQIRGYVDGLETSTGNIDASTASSLTTLNQLLSALQSFKTSFDDRDFGTDLQNVEANLQDIEDSIDRLTSYFVDGEASGIEGDLSAAVSSALQNNGVTSGRMATIEDLLIDMWDNSSNIAGDVARIPSLLTTLNTSVQDFDTRVYNNLRTISDIAGQNRQTLLGIFGQVQKVPPALEEIRLLEDEALSELKITRTDNATWRQYVKNGLVEPFYQNFPNVAEDVKFSRDYLRRYFAVGGVETNRVVQGIVTNITQIHGTNGVVIGATTNYVVKYGTNILNRQKGIFDEFFWDDSPSVSNSLFKRWYNVSYSNGLSVISNQLRQIDYQSNLLLAVQSITNLLATNSAYGLENMISNGLPWGFVLNYQEMDEELGPHPTGDKTHGNSPYTFVEAFSYLFGVPQFMTENEENVWDLLVSDSRKSTYEPITNDLMLLNTRYKNDDAQAGTYLYSPFSPRTSDKYGIATLSQYNSWLLQSMRDSLALLSYGILDSITNSVDGQMQEFDSDEMELPTSDDLNSFRDEAKSGIESQQSGIESAIQDLSNTSQAGEPELVLDFASAGIPGMSERITINFNEATGPIKSTARTVFSWLWRLFGGVYFFFLAQREWDWWIALGRESASLGDLE